MYATRQTRGSGGCLPSGGIHGWASHLRVRCQLVACVPPVRPAGLVVTSLWGVTAGQEVVRSVAGPLPLPCEAPHACGCSPGGPPCTSGLVPGTRYLVARGRRGPGCVPQFCPRVASGAAAPGKPPPKLRDRGTECSRNFSSSPTHPLAGWLVASWPSFAPPKGGYVCRACVPTLVDKLWLQLGFV